ncbi:cytidine deaminase [candidate division KSB1 bacterium]|nr:cytidine deaminase [candidate division KSB1 bacterium]
MPIFKAEIVAEQSEVIMDYQSYIKKAIEAKKSAFAPYSKFRVGAIMVTRDDRSFSGCNIESSTYSLTICAERMALFKAISEGARDFKAIFIAADTEKPCTPCGACRQVIWELAENIEVVMINKYGKFKTRMMKDLLPDAFDENYLEGK